MPRLSVEGGNCLKGTVKASGSKNSALPILAACIMLDGKSSVSNIPYLMDVNIMVRMLNALGVRAEYHNRDEVKVWNHKKLRHIAPYELVTAMRASFFVAGPILAKTGYARVPLPGGCSIGARPVDIHLFVLKKLGAKIKIKNGYIIAEAKNGLMGKKIRLPSISVGATENALIAASYAKGTTYLSNCACEPEIKDLIIFLKKMGVKIQWVSSRKVKILGNQNLKPINHRVMFDRIEAGTFIIAGALSGNKIKILGIEPKILKKEISILKKMGVRLKINKNDVVILSSKNIKPVTVNTEPYPGFPTDLQAQIMVLMTRANGISKIKENIFEKRFMHVPELNRMGAKIKISGDSSLIYGPKQLNGAEVMATDLRASVSLVLAGLAAEEKTIINRVYHLDRGYEKLENKLKKCGANIFRTD